MRDIRIRRRLKAAAPWISGLLFLAAGWWIWDARNYPVPAPLRSPPPKDPFVNPFAVENPVERAARNLREARTQRFWNSLRLPGTTWNVVHWHNGTTSTVHFTEDRIFVDPPEVKIGIPFVNDTKYEMLDSRVFRATSPVPGKDGGVISTEKRSTFEAVEPDGRIYLQTTVDDDFWMEKID